MGNIISYSGLTTKIRAMQAKLLTKEDFETIVSLKTVLEVIDYLKEKPAYAQYINQMDTALYHRGNVEKVLVQSFYDDYSRLFRFAGLEQKKFLKWYWKRYEVGLINYCLRIVFNHYDIPFDIDYKKEIFDKYSQLSVSKLVTSRNIDELIENLKGTEYYAPLRPLHESGEATIFDYDLALDIYCFSNFWKREKRMLKGKEREMFVKDYGTKADLLNMQWIYRAKKYYHMLPPDIYALTIPVHYRIGAGEFKALVEAPTLEEFQKQAEATKYGKHIRFGQGEQPEKQAKAILRGLYRSQRRHNPYSLASLNTYLFMKEEEIDKLITVLECIRYGLTPGETLEYLGGMSE